MFVNHCLEYLCIYFLIICVIICESKRMIKYMTYQDSFKKGSLEMLLLKLLENQDCYGYELSQLLKERSNNIISVPEGSMYPALYRLVDNGYISSKKVKIGVRRERVYYHLEDAGKKYLSDLLCAYHEVAAGISAILTWEDEH